jgi:hypothetical protein
VEDAKNHWPPRKGRHFESEIVAVFGRLVRDDAATVTGHVIDAESGFRR